MMKVYMYTTYIWRGIGHKDDLKSLYHFNFENSFFTIKVAIDPIITTCLYLKSYVEAHGDNFDSVYASISCEGINQLHLISIMLMDIIYGHDILISYVGPLHSSWRLLLALVVLGGLYKTKVSFVYTSCI